ERVIAGTLKLRLVCHGVHTGQDRLALPIPIGQVRFVLSMVRQLQRKSSARLATAGYKSHNIEVAAGRDGDIYRAALGISSQVGHAMGNTRRSGGLRTSL